MIVEFVVYGVPVTQGSSKPIPWSAGKDPETGKRLWDWSRPRMKHSNEKELLSWRQEVATAALAARGDRPGFDREVALAVTVVFYFQRPQSAPRRVTRHTKKPDTDKLLRSFGDALTGIIWADDSQIDEVHGYKRFAAGPLDPLGAAGVPRMVVRVQGQEAALPKDAPLFEEPERQPALLPAKRKAGKAAVEVGF